MICLRTMRVRGPARRRITAGLVLGALAAYGAGVFTLRASDTPAPAAPPFPSSRPADWIGAPVSWADLRGRVVLLDVWTFACGNCQATMPWLKDVQKRYAERGLALVGIHTPEFDFEHDRTRVAMEVRRQGLDYPHLLDNSSAYWNALGNQYWPTVYLVDRCGKLRDRHVGEVHSGEDSGRRVQARIEALLAEPAGACP
jgi:thiol-disulfide isomerase/thioredoxin